jgi:hypothetical protein
VVEFNVQIDHSRNREKERGWQERAASIPHETLQVFLSAANCTLVDKKKQRKLEVLACVSDTEVPPEKGKFTIACH